MEQNLEALATRFVEAFNRGDVETLQALTGHDVRYEGWGAESGGRDGSPALAETVHRVREQAPDVHAEVLSWDLDPRANRVTGLVTWTRPDTGGTMSGRLTLQFGNDGLVHGVLEHHDGDDIVGRCIMCEPVSPFPRPFP